MSQPRPMVTAAARAAAAPAEYRVEVDRGRLYVGMATPDRWLSHSVEADLLHNGDHLEDLIQDELTELEYVGPALGAVEHFRDDDKQFVFRSAIGVNGIAGDVVAIVATCVRAYEAALANLGDMDTSEE